MAFKIKDLMINDLAAAQQGGAGRGIDFLCTPSHTTRCLATPFDFCLTPILACTPSLTRDPNLMAYIGRQAVPVPPESGPTDTLSTLATLKEELKRQLAEVEKQEAALEAELAPKTIEEVDELTKKLQDALEALKTIRHTLPKKP